MDMTRRKELAVELRRSALATSIQIVSDGERLQTQTNMADRLVKEAEDRTAELLVADTEVSRITQIMERLQGELLEARGYI